MTLLEIVFVISVVITMLGATFVGLTAGGLNVVTGLLVGLNVCLLNLYGWRLVCEKVRQHPSVKLNQVVMACLDLIFIHWLLAGGITSQLTYPRPTRQGQSFHAADRHSDGQP